MIYLLALCLLQPSLALAATWPNEPADANTFNEQPHDAITSNGWYDIYNEYQTSIVQDGSASTSPSNVLQQRFVRGGVGGKTGGGGNLYMFPTAVKSLYWGRWIKVDANYENHPVCTKTGWIHTGARTGDQKNQFFFCLGGGGPFQFTANYQNDDADNRHLGGDSPRGSVRLEAQGGLIRGGEWVLLESILVPSTCPTCKNGVLKTWVNKELSINVTTLNTSGFVITGVSHITVWGGTGHVKTRDSFIWWDHEHLSTFTGEAIQSRPVAPPGTVTGVTITVTP